MSDLVLDVSNLSVKFSLQGKNDKVAVNNVNFQLKRGEILGIVGESGSGKSVTSLAIMGLIQHPGKITQESSIKYYQSQHDNLPQDPVELTALEASQWTGYRGKEIAMIFQEPMSAFNPVYTIGYQLTEAIKLHQKNVTQEQANYQAIDLLQQVKVLKTDEDLEEEYLENNKDKKGANGTLNKNIQNYIKQQKKAYLKRYPHELSGGQLQRVMIAMAVSCNPKILIADEPTTALDVTVQKGILELLRGLCKDNNIAMIFISHDLGVINEVADNILVMRQGKVIEEGAKQQIIYHPHAPYTKGLLACRPPLNVKVEKLATVADFSEEKHEPELSKKSDLVNTSATPEVIEVNTKEAENQKVLLLVENLTVEFGKSGIFGLKQSKVKAVNNISFDVKEGETLGLVGESGCGKSTLARTILQLIPASKGSIYFNHQGITRDEKNMDDKDKGLQLSKITQKSLRKKRKYMQIVFQNPYSSLNPRLTVGQAITEPMIIHNIEKSSHKRREKAENLLEKVGLPKETFDRYPHEFSGGQRQRICIARALVLNPSLLICDESVSALDVSVQAEVLNLLKQLQKEFNLAYIFISHDLSVVRFMSDRIMVMKKGEIVEVGDAEEIINNAMNKTAKQYTNELFDSIPKFPEDLKWTSEQTVISE